MYYLLSETAFWICFGPFADLSWPRCVWSWCVCLHFLQISSLALRYAKSSLAEQTTPSVFAIVDFDASVLNLEFVDKDSCRSPWARGLGVFWRVCGLVRRVTGLVGEAHPSARTLWPQAWGALPPCKSSSVDGCSGVPRGAPQATPICESTSAIRGIFMQKLSRHCTIYKQLIRMHAVAILAQDRRAGSSSRYTKRPSRLGNRKDSACLRRVPH